MNRVILFFDNLEVDHNYALSPLGSFQVILGNLPRCISTNRKLPQCKTLLVHFKRNMLFDWLLRLSINLYILMFTND